MTRAQLQAMQDKLFENHNRHLGEATRFLQSNPIWTARMAASHLCLALMEACQAAAAVTPEGDSDEGK